MKRDQKEIDRALKQWLEHTKDNFEVNEELLRLKDNREQVVDVFYKDLEFGTGGLRGRMGAGTNRINWYTIVRASFGLSNYIHHEFLAKDYSVAISYDSRKNSRKFAEAAAGVLAANGISVYIYEKLMPTPMLSWAVRKLKCVAGIMITASHNPADYNGYKVYGSDGCQITTADAKKIFNEIERLDYFSEIEIIPFEEGIKNKSIQFINSNVISEFITEVKQQLLLPEQYRNIYHHLSVVFTPLNGTGLIPVTRALTECGFHNITIVKEQEQPDPQFPTCPYPNPEIKETLNLGIQYARKTKADLLLATDPDCDRVGIAIKTRAGDYCILNANQTGVLLLDYICKQRLATKTMPTNPIFIKTIVTTDLAERVAEFYGVKTMNVLTGFKYIGEQIGFLEEKKLSEHFIFAFEESYGYLSGTYVRDKDGVGASLLICEMCAYYKAQGKTLKEALDTIYERHGHSNDNLHSYQFEGKSGFERMQKIMASFRYYEELLSHESHNMEQKKQQMNIGGKKIIEIYDYLKLKKYDCNGYIEEIRHIPSSDVIKFKLEDGCSFVIRPSGTEPKLKVYVTTNDLNGESYRSIEDEIIAQLKKIIYY